jgi:hypothetical protein
VSKGPWHDGHRAWQRLEGWRQERGDDVPRHPDNGAAAVAALGDIGLIRRLLDQAELGAVRTARRHGKSWAEIATMLGITRQSAWERWRDLDETAPTTSPPHPPVAGEPSAEDEDGLGWTDELTTDLVDAVVTEISAASRSRRRRSMVSVPSVIGMTWNEARHVLMGNSLAAAGPDPDGPPLTADGWPIGLVTDQSPESGAKVPAGSAVRLWIGRGGGEGGVREPRRPSPDPKASFQRLDEATGETVS